MLHSAGHRRRRPHKFHDVIHGTVRLTSSSHTRAQKSPIPAFIASPQSWSHASSSISRKSTATSPVSTRTPHPPQYRGAEVSISLLSGRSRPRSCGTCRRRSSMALLLTWQWMARGTSGARSQLAAAAFRGLAKVMKALFELDVSARSRPGMQRRGGAAPLPSIVAWTPTPGSSGLCAGLCRMSSSIC